MFPRISAVVAIVLAAAGTTSARMERHIHVRQGSTKPQCNTGTLSCCNSAYNATNFASFLEMLSVPFDVTDMVGINCTPMNIFGAGEAAGCQQQPICCSNNTYEGFINVGCSPLDLN